MLVMAVVDPMPRARVDHGHSGEPRDSLSNCKPPKRRSWKKFSSQKTPRCSRHSSLMGCRHSELAQRGAPRLRGIHARLDIRLRAHLEVGTHFRLHVRVEAGLAE